MRACGQKLVKFCAHTHTRGEISSKDGQMRRFCCILERLMLRSNHLVQTVRTTFPVVQTVPFTFPLGISHLHLWRSGGGVSVSVCTAGKKMASLIRKPCIIALQLQLCTVRPRTRYSMITHAPALLVRGLLVGKRVQEVWEKKRKKGKIIIIIIINMKKKEGGGK